MFKDRSGTGYNTGQLVAEGIGRPLHAGHIYGLPLQDITVTARRTGSRRGVA